MSVRGSVPHDNDPLYSNNKRIRQYLLTSARLITNKQINVYEIISGLRSFLQSYTALPVEIKAIIIKYMIHSIHLENKLKNVKRCSKQIVAFCGKEYKQVLKIIFKQNPKKLAQMMEKKRRDFINSLSCGLFSGYKAITIYKWKNGLRKFIVYMVDMDCLSNMNITKNAFDSYSDLTEMCTFTVHSTSSVIKMNRILINEGSELSKDDYFVEGIFMEKFIPIHYVSKNELLSFRV